MNESLQLDVDRLKNSIEPQMVNTIYFDELESTNTWALENLEAHQVPSLVVTANQTAGRGQRGNEWHSSGGSLTFSLALSFEDIAIESRGIIAPAVAVACCRFLSKLTEDGSYQFKWPNDLVLKDRKLGGILIETTSRLNETLVIGIGINVNQNPWLPNPSTSKLEPVSLAQVFEKPFDLTEVLTGLVQEIVDLPAQIRSGNRGQLMSEIDERNWLKDQNVLVESEGKKRLGRFVGLDESGAARIDSGGEISTFHSANITKHDGIG